jgi:hypothetical protein
MPMPTNRPSASADVSGESLSPSGYSLTFYSSIGILSCRDAQNPNLSTLDRDGFV